MPVQIISIEGNIGSGKSTLLSNLKTRFHNHSNIVFLKEPVDEWSNIKDEHNVTILEKFYKDQEKYSFSFQMMAYISRLKLLKQAVENHSSSCENLIIITERSLYTDKCVFAKMLYDSGKIEKINYQIYLQWFDTFIKEFPVHKVIYVKTDPEMCHHRISIRHREGESNIPLEYLQSCDQYHDAMLNTNSAECVCKNQLVLNGNPDIYENSHILDDWIQRIEAFL